jgi:hypothetical protein
VFGARSGVVGLATCFGASTETVGSWAGPVVVCDTAGPHSRTDDKTATAEGTTRLDDTFMAIPLEDGLSIPLH